MRHIIARVAMGAAVAVAFPVGASSVAAAGVPVGTQCATVPYGWAGSTTLSPGESFSTGVVVPSEVGVQLAVAAHDVSTVNPAPGAVAIWIGGGAVADGLPVSGGEIAVTNRGSSDVMLTRVELSLARCYQVASAGPVAVAPVVEADPTAVPAPVAAPTTLAPVLAAPTGVALPATGRSSDSVLLLGVTSTLLGGALVVVARRRTTAPVPGR